MEILSVLRIRTAMALLCSLFLGGFCSIAQAQQTPYSVDNEARSAILRERQRIDSLRTDNEAIRREADTLRRDVSAVQANLDLMLRKVDSKNDEVQVLKNAQLDLLIQLEVARKEVRELRGKIEDMQAGRANSLLLPDVLQQLMEQQRNFEERLNSLAITRK